MGDDRLGYHWVDTNPTNAETAMHDVIEHVNSIVPNILPHTYASLAQMMALKVARYVTLIIVYVFLTIQYAK